MKFKKTTWTWTHLSICLSSLKDKKNYNPLPFHECYLPNYTIYRICYHKRNTTGATCGAGSAYPSGAPVITPSFWWGSCCLFFSFLCCVMCTIVCLFVFFIFSHGVVSLFSIYEFDCPLVSFVPLLYRHIFIDGVNQGHK